MDSLNEIKTIEKTVAIIIVIVYTTLVRINYIGYKNRQEVVSNPLLVVVTLAISVGLLPVFLVIIACFWINRQLVRLLLAIRHGSRFGGLLVGVDVIHVLKIARKSALTVLFVIEYDRRKYSTDFYAHMAMALRKIFVDELRNEPKLFSVVHNFLGYFYYIKNGVTYEDCHRKLNRVNRLSNVIDKSEVMRIIQEHSTDPLPKNHAGLWEVLIGTQRLKWVEKDEKCFYPVVMRVNHSLMDGETIYNLIMAAFADSKIEGKCVTKSQNRILTPVLRCVKYLELVTKSMLSNIAIICLLPSGFLAQLHRASRYNILHGPKLRNKIVVAFKAEESPGYLKIIKEIRNTIKGSSFTDIILTALSSSLDTYFKKRSSIIPQSMTISLTSRPQILDPTKLATSLSDIKFGNRFTFLLCRLPIEVISENGRNVPLTDRLRLVKHQIEIIRKSRDGKINFWCSNVFPAVFPSIIMNKIVNAYSSGLIYTNMPGMSPVTVFGGCSLQDIIPILPHRERTGMCLMSLTYAGRMQLAFVVDSALISDQEEANEILNGIYTGLDLLYNEINGKGIEM